MSARLSFRLLLLALLLLLRRIVCLRVDKCCPPGELLILNEELECVRAEDGAIRLLEPFQNASRGLPDCGSNSYMVERLLEDLGPPIPRNACLDVFLDRPSRQDFPVLVHCKSISRRLASVQLSNYKVPPPRITSLRECCPGNGSVYDVERKICVDGRDEAASLLAERAAGAGFIAVHSGPPRCQFRELLADYRLRPEDVYGSVDGLSITIPWNGQPRNVTLNEYNGCLDASSSPGYLTARICTGPEYCLSNACIRKCCAEGQVTAERGMCQDSVEAEKFRALLSEAASNSSAEFDVQRYGLFVGRPCKAYYGPEPWETWRIDSRGGVLLDDGTYWNHIDSCLDIVLDDSGLDIRLMPYLCFDNEVHYTYDPRFDVKGGLVCVSCFFLLITLLVYICLPALQNLHGKTLMSHVISLFFAYASLGLITLATHRILDDVDDLVADSVCRYLGYTMIFCFHSAFFWLNVMCFDIWRTFGGIHGAASNSAGRGSRQQRNKFLAYCAYAWGLAFVLTGLSVIFERTGVLSSSIGRERCWYENQSSAELIFFIGPVSVTLLINTALFGQTAHRCSKVKAEIKRVMANVKDPKARKFHSDKTRLIMNLKLFIVMGIPWLLENLSSLLNHYQQQPTWVMEMFYAADAINALQGLWIFILFVLKPKVYRALKKRLRIQRKSKESGSNCNTLNVQRGLLHGVRKSSSVSTLTSNFVVSSTA